jgi:VanZ family protein
MAVIFVFSNQPDVGPLPYGITDSLGHFAGYAILGALVVRAIAGARWSGVTTRAAGLAWIVSAAYGITDEYHQSFVAGRSPSAADWVADAAGAAAAIATVVAAARWRRRRRERAV